MEEMTVDGATIAWSDSGSGEATLLVHAGVFGAWFAPLATRLPGRVIRMLRAGYTDGPLPISTIGIVEHAAHAAALLDRLRTGPASVVGHSSGTLIVLQLAQDRPDLVRRLVLCEPPLLDPLLDPADVAENHAMFERVFGVAMAATAQGDRRAAYDAFMGAVGGPNHRDVVAEVLGPDGLARAERDSTFFYTNETSAINGWTPVDPAGIAAPVLLVAGGESSGVTQRMVARLAGLLPDAQVATIAGANHLLPLTHPAELAGLITSRSAAPPGSSPHDRRS
jgi:pimeloyl-ACP methyl ester carboxylesterase